MRYYIAYKFLNTDKEILKNNLENICNKIEKMGDTTYIFYRDAQNRGETAIPIDQIIQKAFIEVKKSDIILAFIENEEKSEGMLLEIWYAKALGKKLLLVIKKWINLRFVRSLADETIEFDKIENIKIM